MATISESPSANVDLNQVANLLEQSTLQNLRSFQHVDANGNPIG